MCLPSLRCIKTLNAPLLRHYLGVLPQLFDCLDELFLLFGGEEPDEGGGFVERSREKDVHVLHVAVLFHISDHLLDERDLAGIQAFLVDEAEEGFHSGIVVELGNLTHQKDEGGAAEFPPIVLFVA